MIILIMPRPTVAYLTVTLFLLVLERSYFDDFFSLLARLFLIGFPAKQEGAFAPCQPGQRSLCGVEDPIYLLCVATLALLLECLAAYAISSAAIALLEGDRD